MKRYFIGLVIVLLAAGGVWWLAAGRDGGAGDLAKEMEKKLERYQELMRADKAGGATPEETLRLFVEALRAKDRERAASYFLLDENGSRKVWEEALAAKSDEELLKIAEVVEGAEARGEDSINENDLKYVVVNEGVVEVTVDLEFNKLSKVWKIESL